MSGVRETTTATLLRWGPAQLSPGMPPAVSSGSWCQRRPICCCSTTKTCDGLCFGCSVSESSFSSFSSLSIQISSSSLGEGRGSLSSWLSGWGGEKDAAGKLLIDSDGTTSTSTSLNPEWLFRGTSRVHTLPIAAPSLQSQSM